MNEIDLRRLLTTSADTAVSINFPNEVSATEERWVAYPYPQMVVRFYHGVTGELLCAESVVAGLDNE